MYCPHCGNETDHAIPLIPAAADTVDREVEIARIQAERDIEVAKIGARQDRDWNETRVEVAGIEAEAEVASAEATAEVIGEIIAAETDTPEEPETEADPVIITAEPEDDGLDIAPPETEQHDSGPVKKPGWSFS